MAITPKEQADRINELTESIAELCKTTADHAIRCHVAGDGDVYPNDSECIVAWDNLYAALIDNFIGAIPK